MILVYCPVNTLYYWSFGRPVLSLLIISSAVLADKGFCIAIVCFEVTMDMKSTFKDATFISNLAFHHNRNAGENEPFFHLSMFVGRVIVRSGEMEVVLSIRRRKQILLVSVPFFTAGEHFPCQYIQSGKAKVPDGFHMVLVPLRPCFKGRPGWLRSSAWICDFSSTLKTSAFSVHGHLSVSQ